MPLISPSLPDGVPGSNAGTAGKAAGPSVEPDVRERFNVESDISCLRTKLNVLTRVAARLVERGSGNRTTSVNTGR